MTASSTDRSSRLSAPDTVLRDDARAVADALVGNTISLGVDVTSTPPSVPTSSHLNSSTMTLDLSAESSTAMAPSLRRASQRTRRQPDRLTPARPSDRVPVPFRQPPATFITGRDGIRVSSSSIAGVGLFPPPSGLQRAAFIAIVFGVETDTADAHTLAVDEGSFVRPRYVNGFPDLSTFQWAAANEPPEGCVANAVFIPYYATADVIAGAPPSARCIALALHAAIDIGGGTEITVHYSPHADDCYAPFRLAAGYLVGSPGSLLRKDIPLEELPAAHLGTSAPLFEFSFGGLGDSSAGSPARPLKPVPSGYRCKSCGQRDW